MSETPTVTETASKIPAAMNRLAFFMGESPGFFYLISGAADQVEKTGDLSLAWLPLNAAERAAEAASNQVALRAINDLKNLCRLILSGDVLLAANGPDVVARLLADCMTN